jgi:hypothetical protein
VAEKPPATKFEVLGHRLVWQGAPPEVEEFGGGVVLPDFVLVGLETTFGDELVFVFVNSIDSFHNKWLLK